MKVIFLIFILVSSRAHADHRAPYSDNDVEEIQRSVLSALDADEAALRLNSGKYRAETLMAIGVTSDFKAFGDTVEEAEIKSAMLCIRFRCQKMPIEINNAEEIWANEPPEQLMDELRAAGKLNSFPDNLRADPAALKAYLLVQRKTLTQNACRDPKQVMLRHMTYILCNGAGFSVEKIK